AGLSGRAGVVAPEWWGRLEGEGAAGVATASPVFWLATLWLAFLLVLLTNPLKGLRFLTPLFAPTALLAGAGLRAGLAAAAARLSPASARVLWIAAIAALLLAAFGDLRRFFDLFVRRGLPDLATPWFTSP